MKYMESIVKNGSWFSLGVSVAVVLLFGAAMVHGTSTISTNIDTEGTLNADGATTLGSTLAVTGASTLTGNVTAAGTLAVTGASTLTGASTFTADAVFNGGIDAVTLTHTNAATSSITVGCIDTFATSTESPIMLAFTADSVATTTFGADANGGTVVWTFGSCS